MSIGRLQNEGDLTNFIRQELEGSNLAVLIRQLQVGAAAQTAMFAAIAGKALKFGVATVSFPNTKVSTPVTVAHGCAGTPVLLDTQATVTSGGRHDTGASVDAVNSTTFDLYGLVTEDVNTLDTLSIYWWAIG